MSGYCTVQQHFIQSQRKHPRATGDLTGLLWDISIAAKIISREVNKAGLGNILGFAGKTNASGDRVAKLDRFAQDTLVSALSDGGHVCCMASEEEEDVIPVLSDRPGKYVVVFDPLDGSSNIDANVSVGTVFGIFRRRSTSGPGTIEDLLQPGRSLVAAGYVVYGSSTMLVYSAGDGAHGFTLDPSIGEFLLSHPDIRIPSGGKIYSINEGNHLKWDEATRRYIAHLKSAEAGPFSLRYIGSMVADVHRTLLYGGVFLYPAEANIGRDLKAKLRLLYEAGPMAYVVEQAGGMASSGLRRTLNIQPSTLHERAGLITGSPDQVLLYQEFLRQERRSLHRAA